MKPNPRQPPADAELDRLLASQVKRTSPEFEQRWRERRNEFVNRKPASFRWRPWLLWPGLATAVVAVALTIVARREATTFNSTPPPTAFEALLSWDATLAVALPLLPAENREALLHLPAPANL